MGSKESRRLNENESGQGSARASVRAVLETSPQTCYSGFGGRFGYLRVLGAYPPALFYVGAYIYS